MSPESQNNPFPDNGSLTHVAVTRPFARQRLGKQGLKAGIVEPDMGIREEQW
jgi:hypothetical protein